MRTILLAILCSLATLGSFAQSSAVRQQGFNLEKNLAIQSYDPVSYRKGGPVKGSAAFATVYNGVTYRFASAQNLATFKSNPASYEPQYGGWCAYAMGNSGEKVEIDPETYKILNGKLYLFYNQYFNNTLKSWNKSEVKLKGSADANWARLFP